MHSPTVVADDKNLLGEGRIKPKNELIFVLVFITKNRILQQLEEG